MVPSKYKSLICLEVELYGLDYNSASSLYMIFVDNT